MTLSDFHNNIHVPILKWLYNYETLGLFSNLFFFDRLPASNYEEEESGMRKVDYVFLTKELESDDEAIQQEIIDTVEEN